jgi:hypothetical protein
MELSFNETSFINKPSSVELGCRLELCPAEPRYSAELRATEIGYPAKPGAGELYIHSELRFTELDGSVEPSVNKPGGPIELSLREPDFSLEPRPIEPGKAGEVRFVEIGQAAEARADKPGATADPCLPEPGGSKLRSTVLPLETSEQALKQLRADRGTPYINIAAWAEHIQHCSKRFLRQMGEARVVCVDSDPIAVIAMARRPVRHSTKVQLGHWAIFYVLAASCAPAASSRKCRADEPRLPGELGDPSSSEAICLPPRYRLATAFLVPPGGPTLRDVTWLAKWLLANCWRAPLREDSEKAFVPVGVTGIEPVTSAV